jgi:hypothetical protein
MSVVEGRACELAGAGFGGWRTSSSSRDGETTCPLRYALRTLPPSPPPLAHATLQAVVRHILDEGLAGAAELQQRTGSSSSSSSGQSGGNWALMYSWHNKRYLGAAHGEQ